MQIADAPGRGEPGTGPLDLDRYLDATPRPAATTGYVGLEYKPTATADAFAWLPRADRAADG